MLLPSALFNEVGRSDEEFTISKLYYVRNEFKNKWANHGVIYGVKPATIISAKKGEKKQRAYELVQADARKFSATNVACNIYSNVAYQYVVSH